MSEQKILYRQLIGRFATGVAVITGETGGKVVGMTVNSLTSVSLDPLLLLFCARNESVTAEHVLSSGKFTVNILHQAQLDVSRRFAGKPDIAISEPVREDGFVWIEGASAVFRCEIDQVHPAGDHKIVVGKVVSMSGPEVNADPLLFYNGKYAAISAEPRPA